MSFDSLSDSKARGVADLLAAMENITQHQAEERFFALTGKPQFGPYPEPAAYLSQMQEALREARESRNGNMFAIATHYFPELTKSGYLKTCPGCGKNENVFRVYRSRRGDWAWGCLRVNCSLSFDNLEADGMGDEVGLVAYREGCTRHEAVDKYLEIAGVENPRCDRQSVAS